MALLKSGENLYPAVLELVKSGKNLLLIAPYVKQAVLEKLLATKPESTPCTVVTTWVAADVINGATDLDCYLTCTRFQSSLLVNNRIHLKAFIEYRNSALVGSANLTESGLGLSAKYNYEIAAPVTLVDSDNDYFDEIINESIPITQEIYENVKAQMSEVDIQKTPEFELDLTTKAEHFLLSSLPQTDNPARLFEIYLGKAKAEPRELASAKADLLRYKIPAGLPEKEFETRLTEVFFAHPFISALLEYNNHYVRDGLIGRQFGDLRRWIEANTTQVPTPRIFEINDPLNHVYNWVVELGQDKYEKVQPGAHTWVLRVKSPGLPDSGAPRRKGFGKR